MENKKGKLGSRLAGSEAFLSVAASLICIVIGLLLGLVVLAIINAEHAFGDGLLVILKSGFKSPRNMGTVLANAAPLIMTGLSALRSKPACSTSALRGSTRSARSARCIAPSCCNGRGTCACWRRCSSARFGARCRAFSRRI